MSDRVAGDSSWIAGQLQERKMVVLGIAGAVLWVILLVSYGVFAARAAGEIMSEDED
jgi:hypothetical protein